MSARYRVLVVMLAVSLVGCSLLRPGGGSRLTATASSPVAKSTVWPAPGGNLTTCTPSGPAGDAPVPPGPADTIKVRNKTVRQLFAELCSASIPVPRTSTGKSSIPGQ